MQPDTDLANDYAGEKLARFVTTSRWEDIPDPLRHEAKRSILNFFGTAIASAHEPAVQTAFDVLQPFAGPAQATVFGRPEQLDLLSATFINALSANLLDFDDTHLPTVIHPTAPVAPALFAVAEQRLLSGADVLHAFLLGGEIECRIGNSVSPGHYARGWHITSTCGVFGAAAGAAKLLSLDTAATWHALGDAASVSAGIVENLTTAAKNIGVGNAARNGLLAAFMAEQGYAAAPAALEGPLGWARATGSELDATVLTAGLGEHWEIGRNTYKPYPAGIVMHPVIDACFELARDHGVKAADIASVTVRGHPLMLERGQRSVENGRDARVSIHHCVAVVFLFGAAGLEEFDDSVVLAPAATGFRKKVQARVDAGMAVGAARVEVCLTGGETLTTFVAEAIGSEAKPMSDAALEEKFRSLVSRNAAVEDTDALIDAIWTLDKADTVSGITQRAGGR